MAKVAFIGLGVMGYPMAAHLKNRGGHEVTVYNRTQAKAAKWVEEHGGSFAATPREAAEGKDFVFSCVGNDDDLREVTIGENGVFHSMKPGSVYIDNTTASAEVARELAAEAEKRGFHFIDAPVSGGQAGAENGQLSVMVGGEAEALARVEAVLRAILRAGGYELMFRKDVPARVVITEYVDVTHSFYDQDEPGLVNAVLDTLAREVRAGELEKKTAGQVKR